MIHLHISATAHIAHKVTKNVIFVVAFPYSAHAALNSTFLPQHLTASNFAKVADDAEVVACDGIEVEADVAKVTDSKENESVHSFDLGGKSIHTNESVHYHHRTDG